MIVRLSPTESQTIAIYNENNTCICTESCLFDQALSLIQQLSTTYNVGEINLSGIKSYSLKVKGDLENNLTNFVIKPIIKVI